MGFRIFVLLQTERECTFTAHCAVKGSLSSWDLHVYVWIQFVIASTNQIILYSYFFVRESSLHKLTFLQSLKQFKLVNLYSRGFEDWSCGHWRTYLSTIILCLYIYFRELMMHVWMPTTFQSMFLFLLKNMASCQHHIKQLNSGNATCMLPLLCSNEC